MRGVATVPQTRPGRHTPANDLLLAWSFAVRGLFADIGPTAAIKWRPAFERGLK